MPAFRACEEKTTTVMARRLITVKRVFRARGSWKPHLDLITDRADLRVSQMQIKAARIRKGDTMPL